MVQHQDIPLPEVAGQVIEMAVLYLAGIPEKDHQAGVVPGLGRGLGDELSGERKINEGHLGLF